MRTKAFLKNGFVGVVSHFAIYFMEFLCRTVFIHTLSIEYVGVEGLFTNILSVLSLTELGIGTVLVYSMYRPFAEGDEQKLLALIGFYKKAYRIIAFLVGGIGLLLIPILPFLIKDCPDIDGLYIIYLLYLANSVASCLFTYKTSIFNASQELYINNYARLLFSFLRNIVRIIVLIFTKNFFLYVCIQIFSTLGQNLFHSYLAEKKYPFLKTKKYPKLTKDETSLLMKNTFAMFNHRVGGMVLNSTDNLIISSFVGLTAVAINDNYVLITSAINTIMNQIFNALTASVGNLIVTEKLENTYNILKILQFAAFWVYSFCVTCLFLLLNPFIELVWGEEYLFPLPIVAIICLNFYVVGMRRIPLVFRDAMGLFRHDQYKPLIEAVVNLVISIIAVHFLGVAGVFIGTFLSIISVAVWVETYVLFKHGFKRSWREFWITNLKYYFFSFLTVTLSYFAGTLYHGGFIYEFIYKIIICIILPNILFLLLFHRCKEFKELLSSIHIKELFH